MKIIQQIMAFTYKFAVSLFDFVVPNRRNQRGFKTVPHSIFAIDKKKVSKRKLNFHDFQQSDSSKSLSQSSKKEKKIRKAEHTSKQISRNESHKGYLQESATFKHIPNQNKQVNILEAEVAEEKVIQDVLFIDESGYQISAVECRRSNHSAQSDAEILRFVVEGQQNKILAKVGAQNKTQDQRRQQVRKCTMFVHEQKRQQVRKCISLVRDQKIQQIKECTVLVREQKRYQKRQQIRWCTSLVIDQRNQFAFTQNFEGVQVPQKSILSSPIQIEDIIDNKFKNFKDQHWLIRRQNWDSQFKHPQTQLQFYQQFYKKECQLGNFPMKKFDLSRKRVVLLIDLVQDQENPKFYQIPSANCLKQ